MKKLLLAGVSASVLVLAGGSAFAQTTATATVNPGNTAIANNVVADGPLASERDNMIDNSFDSLSGVHVIQQNNGSANRILTANAVMVDLSGVSGPADPDDATVTANARVYGAVDENDITIGTPSGTPEDRDNEITDTSFDGMTGIVTVQQNNGDVNDLGVANSVVAAVDEGAEDIVQNVTTIGNVDVATGGGDPTLVDPGLTVVNEIDSSFNDDAAGVANVQQNNGNNNTIGAANSVVFFDDVEAFDIGGGDDPDVTQTVSTSGTVGDVETRDEGSDRSNSIIDSFRDFEGVANVQQNNGTSNALGISVAVAAIWEDTNEDRDVIQNVSATGSVTDQAGDGDDVVDIGSVRSNVIDPSFDDFDGVANVQQNNGDGNVLGAATGIVVNLQGDGNNDALDDYNQTVRTLGTIDDIELARDRRAGAGDRDNLIGDSSFEESSGILTVQQNNGNGNVLGSAIGVSVDLSEDTTGGTEDVFSQTVTTTGTVNSPDTIETLAVAGGDADRRNEIDTDAFEDIEGVVTVQQNNGDGNVLGSAVAVAATIGGDDIDSSTQTVSTTGTVALTSSDDNILDRSSNRLNVIDDAGDRTRGVISVGQNNGNGNVIGSAVGVVATVDTLLNSAGQSSNTATVNGTVTGVPGSVVEANSFADRTNTIDDAFENAEGVGTVYQNNGDANVIGSAIAVAVYDTGDGEDGFANAVSTATLNGVVTGMNINTFSSSDVGTEFTNTITSEAFDGASGVLNIIQNNGNGNVIGAATTVTANVAIDSVSSNFDFTSGF